MDMTCLLSDRQIREFVRDNRLVIEPFSGSVEPASYDLRMGNRVISLTRGYDKTLHSGDHIAVHPGELILIESMEKVGFPPDLQGRISSKVGWLTKGLSNIATKVDPGYGHPQGWHLLLVFKHCGHEPIDLSPGIAICSLEIEKLVEAAETPYSGQTPKTVFVKPIESVDPLRNVKECDFTELKKDDVEKFYGHPLDDLFLAVGSLQTSIKRLEKRLPRPRPLWITAVVIYLIFIVMVSISWLCVHAVFPLPIHEGLLLAIYAILGGAIGAILVLYSRRREQN